MGARRACRLAVAIGCCVTVMSCGGTTNADVASTATNADVASTVKPGSYQRNCDVPPRVPGKLPADWKERSVAIGPIYLYGGSQHRQSPQTDFEPLPHTSGKRYSGQKQLVFVRGGPVTLSVAPAQRKVVSLNYGKTSFDNGFAVTDGSSSVTFSDCGVPVTQWAGAFIVAGARCVRLAVRDGGGVVVGSARIPFGRKAC